MVFATFAGIVFFRSSLESWASFKTTTDGLVFFLKVTTFIGEHRNMDGTFPLVHVIIPFLILFFF